MNVRSLALALAVVCGATTLTASAIVPASADEVVIVDEHGVPSYDHWRAEWDRYEFDRHHVILGTVTNFAPYRLQVVRRNGNLQMIDLKNGTVILPTGATPMPNERVAIVGYYSQGTFIANRVLIHP
jgi:hypothetical protein